MKNVDKDNDCDLLLFFKIRDLTLTPQSTEASLEGETDDGELFIGTDSVKIVQ
jgi:hypothetical protein